MKQLIRQILKEETENKKINSIVDMIWSLFDDVVVDIEVGEIRQKPIIRVQIKTDDPAANIDSWYAHEIVDIISEYTGDGFKLKPWWSPLTRNEVFNAYIDVYRKSYDDDDEGNVIKESKEETNYLPIIKVIVEPFKEDEGICDFDLWYDDEDDMYGIFLVFGTEELNDKYVSNGKNNYIIKKRIEVKETIQSYLPIQNLYVGSYEKPNCGWKPLNESKDDIQKNLRAIREILKTISFDGLCDIWVEHNPEDGEYEIRSKTTVSYYNTYVYYQEFEYLENIIRSLGVRPYIFTPFYVEKCEDEVEFLN